MLKYLLLISLGYSAVLKVPEEYTTIQSGIDAAVDGDTVAVYPALYYENITVNKSITLTSLALFDTTDNTIAESLDNWLEESGSTISVADENINTTIINGVLAEIWQTLHQKTHLDIPNFKSKEWKEWVVSELAQPLRAVPRMNYLSKQAQATLAMLEQVKHYQRKLDSKTFGVFVLSMTQTSTDVLGVYLLAKYVGLFTDADGLEACRMLVVPLLETIEDLENGKLP